MKRELEIFFAGLMFFTRIPCPDWVKYSPELLEKSHRYFPLIGLFVGTVAALVFYLSRLIFPCTVSVIFSMLAGILTTGGFHEDGLSDVCDGFGGGWTKDKILEIMKDSRIGAYGVIGLVLALLAKYSSSLELCTISTGYFMIALLVAHTISRVSASAVILFFDYARADATSKVKPLAKKLNLTDFLIGLSTGIIPLSFASYFYSFYLWVIIIPLSLLVVWLGRYFRKTIGGFTGDCLGTVQQVTEILVYLCMLGIWKFIY